MKLMKMLFTFMLVFTIAACSSDTNNAEETLEGIIVNIESDNVLMDSTEHGWVSFTINEDIEYEDEVSEELKIGNNIKLEYEGELMESYPYQVSGEIEIMKNEEKALPQNLVGFFEDMNIITVNRLDEKDAILYSRDFDFCAQALEKVYEDEDGAYYLSCMSSQHYAVYSNGEFMSLIDAFEQEVIHPMDVTEYINIRNESEAVSK